MQRLYEIKLDGLRFLLPNDSKAREADNSWVFKEFLDQSWTFPNVINFPHLILCFDKVQDTYTWHLHCREYPRNEILSKKAREWRINERISDLRKRNIECREYITREGEHFFLD